MPAAYSQDLRRKSVSAYKNGEGTQKQIAKRFSIGLRTLQEWLELQDETGDLRPREPISRGRACIINDKRLSFIKTEVEKRPDILVSEIIELLKKKFRIKVSISMVSRALSKLHLRRKKKSVYAQEQERSDVKKNGRSGKKR